MGVLDGKVAIVTGAGRGLGRAYARRFAAEGASVVVNDSGCSPGGVGADRSPADEVVETIRADGGKAIADYGDVSERKDVESLFRSAIESFGKVDIVVCNAGIVRGAPMSDLTDEDHALCQGMVKSNFLCAQALAAHLKGSGRPGRFLAITSLMAFQGGVNMGLYSAAKAGIYAFAVSAAQELAAAGITVNVIAPMALTRLSEGIPNAKVLFGDPELVADVATFLVSDAAADVTGKVVDVQGRQVASYKVTTTVPVAPKGGARWSVAELAERWTEIVR